MAGGQTIAALDIGTSKICCFIGEISDGGRLSVQGVSNHASQGIRAGVVVDMDAAQRTIMKAVHAAEQMAERRITSVVVALNGAHIESRMIFREQVIGAGMIRESDMRRLSMDARAQIESENRILLHAIPAGYCLDGGPLLREPVGMHAHTLGIRMLAATAGRSAVQNIATCVSRCHLEISRLVAAPYAAGLSSLVGDERELGSILIDIGGGVSSFCVFHGGVAVHMDCLPVGGDHVTADIARGLSTTRFHAERLKTVYGSAVPSDADAGELLDAPQVGERDDGHSARVPKSILTAIISARVEETFELIRARLTQSPLALQGGGRLVLVGGGSRLHGVCDAASAVFDQAARPGRPQGIAGLAEATGGPAFAAAVGLLHYAMDDRNEIRPTPGRAMLASSGGVFRQMGGWFRENF